MAWIKSTIGDEEALISLDSVRCVTKERKPDRCYDQTQKYYIYKCWFKNTQVYQEIDKNAYDKLVVHFEKCDNRLNDNYDYLI